MAIDVPTIEAARIVVIMPNWLGDAVMATPFLRALRGMYPKAHIAAVGRKLVGPVVEGNGLVDEMRVVEKGDEGGVARWLRGEKFDLGILLPNSFRSAWTLWRGRVKRRLGYARGGRSILLTDRVRPIWKTKEQRRKDDEIRLAIMKLSTDEADCEGDLLAVDLSAAIWTGVMVQRRMHSTGAVQWVKEGTPDTGTNALLGWYQPVPTIDYYLELARYLSGGSGTVSKRVNELAPSQTVVLGREKGGVDQGMVLGVTGAEAAEAEGALASMGIGEEEAFVVMVPGANFGASKCWLPERFAAVADAVAMPVEKGGRFGAKVVVASSPNEMPIVEAIMGAIGKGGPPEGGTPAVQALGALNGGKGVSVGALKEIVRRSRLMICNDTGPRHFAAAFGVPTVTLFGPTDPVWAETYSTVEKIVRVPVPCGPCQLKKCPIDHRCMKGITVEMVLGVVGGLWGTKGSEGRGADVALPVLRETA